MFPIEILMAREFLKTHKFEPIISELLKILAEMENTLNSDKWSYIYDFIYENYGRIECFGYIVTGLTYLSDMGGLENEYDEMVYL